MVPLRTCLEAIKWGCPWDTAPAPLKSLNPNKCNKDLRTSQRLAGSLGWVASLRERTWCVRQDIKLTGEEGGQTQMRS